VIHRWDAAKTRNMGIITTLDVRQVSEEQCAAWTTGLLGMEPRRPRSKEDGKCVLRQS